MIDRRAYLVPSTGKLTVNGVALVARDGAAISSEDAVEIAVLADSDLLLADSP